MPSYRVLVGMNYRPGGSAREAEVRHEPGDIVSDLPEKSIAGLLKDKAIEKVAEKPGGKS